MCVTPCGCPRIYLCWIDTEFDSLNIHLLLEYVVLSLLPNRRRFFIEISTLRELEVPKHVAYGRKGTL